MTSVIVKHINVNEYLKQSIINDLESIPGVIVVTVVKGSEYEVEFDEQQTNLQIILKVMKNLGYNILTRKGKNYDYN